MIRQFNKIHVQYKQKEGVNCDLAAMTLKE